MGRVAILADDLTGGALGTAAPFAAKDEAVTAAWKRAAVAGCGSFAFDAQAREASARHASAKILSCRPRLRDAEIGFKKPASLMHGNTIEALAASAGVTMLISKSGAVGDGGLLVRILDNAAEGARG